MDQAELSKGSGAAKRRRLKKLKEEKTKLCKITSFCTSTASTSLETDAEDENIVRSVDLKEDEGTVEYENEDVNLEAATTNSGAGAATKRGDIFNTADVRVFEVEEEACRNQDVFLSSLINEPYPSDKGNFLNMELTDKIKRFIINQRSCQPNIVFPKNNENRSFSEFCYINKSHAGQICPRSWLCYTLKEDRAYCAPCWLFSSEKTSWKYRPMIGRVFQKKIKKHKKAQFHITCCYIYDQWKANQCLGKSLEEQIRSESSFWQKVLSRLH